jgi:hypothetical protein
MRGRLKNESKAVTPKERETHARLGCVVGVWRDRYPMLIERRWTPFRRGAGRRLLLCLEARKCAQFTLVFAVIYLFYFIA